MEVLCERCHQRPVAGAARPWFMSGAVFLAFYGVRPVVGCEPCFRRGVLLLAARNAVVGWWSLPWGLLTPLIVAQNLFTLYSGPSPELVGLVRHRAATSPEARATGQLTVASDADGRVRVDVAPDREPLPASFIGGCVVVAFVWGAVLTGFLTRESGVPLLLSVVVAPLAGTAASLFATALLAQRVRGVQLLIGDGRVTVVQDRTWRTDTWSAPVDEVERIEPCGRAVVFRAPREAWISMPGRHERGVARIAEELHGLLVAARGAP